MADGRTLASFPRAAQSALRNGQQVRAGDGRIFVFINGEPMVLNGAAYKQAVSQANGVRSPSTGQGFAPSLGPSPAGSTAGQPVPVQATTMSTPDGWRENAANPQISVSPDGRSYQRISNDGRTTSAYSTDGLPEGAYFDAAGQLLGMPGARPGKSGKTYPGGAASPDPAAAAASAAQNAANADAFAQLQEDLAAYGLESMTNWAWEQIVGGKSNAEILRDLRKTPEFGKRFPAIAEREKAGLAPISPGEYVAYERQARQVFRAAGLPEGFYDAPEDFTRYIALDLSPAELNDRVNGYRRAAFEVPAETRATLERDYGVGPGDLAAFFMDPGVAQPLLEQRFAASQIGGAGMRTGFGSTRAENEQLASLGVTADRAQEGFGQLMQSAELFQPLDMGEQAIGRDEQIGAAFGTNPNAERRVRQRARRRAAAFEGGGGFASGQGGVSGLGSGPRT